jgi:hypothetical protein
VAQTETSALEKLLQPLADGTRAEFLVELRKLSLHQDDDELFKLLKILSLYAAFYQTIPKTIRDVHDRAIARIEALVGEPKPNRTTCGDGRIESLLKDLADAVNALRSACPPPFEEFRANVENLQANAAKINRYGRELIVELQKNSARAKRGWTAGSGSIIFTAFGSAAIGAVTVFFLMWYFHL